jgi:hypothetical protein
MPDARALLLDAAGYLADHPAAWDNGLLAPQAINEASKRAREFTPAEAHHLAGDARRALLDHLRLSPQPGALSRWSLAAGRDEAIRAMREAACQ